MPKPEATLGPFMNSSCGVHLGFHVSTCSSRKDLSLAMGLVRSIEMMLLWKDDIENGKCPMSGLIDFGCQRVVGNMMFAMIPVGAKMIKMSCSCCRQGWHVWHGSLPFLSVPAYHACHISRAPNKNVFAPKKCYIALAIFVGQVRVKVTHNCL